MIIGPDTTFIKKRSVFADRANTKLIRKISLLAIRA